MSITTATFETDSDLAFGMAFSLGSTFETWDAYGVASLRADGADVLVKRWKSGDSFEIVVNGKVTDEMGAYYAICAAYGIAADSDDGVKVDALLGRMMDAATNAAEARARKRAA